MMVLPRLLVAFMVLFLALPGFAIEVFSPVLVKEFMPGNRPGEFDIFPGNNGGKYPSPFCFFFPSPTEIAIFDIWNERIQFFNTTTFIQSRKPVYFSANNVVEASRLTPGYIIRNTYGSLIVNRDFVKRGDWISDFPWNTVLGDRLWIDGPGSSQIEEIDLEGKIVDHELAIEHLRNLNVRLFNGGQYEPSVDLEIQKLINSGAYLVLDGSVRTVRFEKAVKFLDLFIGTTFRRNRESTANLVAEKFSLDMVSLVGYADDGTSYWGIPHFESENQPDLDVISRHGDLLAKIDSRPINPYYLRKAKQGSAAQKTPAINSGPYERVDSAGNLWYMVSYSDRVQIFEVKRQW